MTVERSYRCNLCCQMIADDTVGIGIYWTGASVIQARAMASVEHHLCHRCLRAIQALPKLPDEPAPIQRGER